MPKSSDRGVDEVIEPMSRRAKKLKPNHRLRQNLLQMLTKVKGRRRNLAKGRDEESLILKSLKMDLLKRSVRRKRSLKPSLSDLLTRKKKLMVKPKVTLILATRKINAQSVTKKHH
jgi:hypothetical protein